MFATWKGKFCLICMMPAFPTLERNVGVSYSKHFNFHTIRHAGEPDNSGGAVLWAPVAAGHQGGGVCPAPRGDVDFPHQRALSAHDALLPPGGWQAPVPECSQQ